MRWSRRADGIVARLARARRSASRRSSSAAGRRTKEDEVDHAVGIVCSAKRGQTVEAGQVLADVHARDEDVRSTGRRSDVLAAYEIGDEPPPVHGIVLDVVG